MNTNPLIDQICKVSKHKVCLLDMQQVADKAKELGLLPLAETIETDLKNNRILSGEYAAALSMVMGVQVS